MIFTGELPCLRPRCSVAFLFFNEITFCHYYFFICFNKGMKYFHEDF